MAENISDTSYPDPMKVELSNYQAELDGGSQLSKVQAESFSFLSRWAEA